jgi:uncharacterized protein YbjT (DUF2867 family)
LPSTISTVGTFSNHAAFADAAKAAGVRHVIKFSGLDARSDTTFPFGIMHKEIEEYLGEASRKAGCRKSAQSRIACF